MAKEQHADSPEKAHRLILIAWVASVAALGICAWTFLDMGFSEPYGRASAGRLLLLAVGPVVALGAMFEATARCRVTAGRFAAMFVPGVLALAELAFVVLLWRVE